MPVPGGPGYPPNGAPVLDALSPLAAVPPANRGATAEICPPDGDCVVGPEILVADLRTWSGCVNAYLLGVVLGIETQCKDPESLVRDEFVHVAVRAILRWGVGGSNQLTAECDWLLGTQLSIAAEKISVSARYVKTTLPWAPESFDDAPAFTVGAGFALGNVGRNSNPARLTEIVMIENPGETVRVPVPNFALSFTVQPVQGSPQFVRKYGFGTSFGVDGSFASPLSNVAQYNVENAIPLANGDRFIEFRNDGQGPAIAFVIFGLGL